MRRASFVAVTILAVLLCGIVGAVIFRVAAEQQLHSVLLKWEAPPPKPSVVVTGYKVYRRSSDGSYEAIASVTTTTYTDGAVRDGQTYHYFVRSVNAKGDESPISNPVTVTIQ